MILALVNACCGLLWAKIYNKRGWKSIIMPMLIAYIFMFILLSNMTMSIKFILPIIFTLYGIGESVCNIQLLLLALT